MGKFLITLLLTFACMPALASIEGSPFNPSDDRRFDSIETLKDKNGIQLADGSMIVGDASGNANAVAMSGDATIINSGAMTVANGAITEVKVVAQTADGLHLKRVARATLDCAASSCVAGDVGMGVSLPAKAIITQAYFHTITQFVDGGAGTVALKCEDAANIFAAADITGITVGTNTSGVPTGTAATMVDSIAAACVITATIAVAEQTAGVLNLFLEYVVQD